MRVEFKHAHERGKGSTLRFYGPDWLAQFYRTKYEVNPDDNRRSERRERREEIELRNAELDLGEREGRLVDADQFFRDRLGPCLDRIRASVEIAADRYPDVRGVVLGGVDEGIERLQANGSTHHLTGDRSSGAKGRSKATAKPPAKPPGVRKEVREDAAGRSKGWGKVS